MFRIAACLVLSFVLVGCGTSGSTTSEAVRSGDSPNKIDVSELSYPVGVLTAYEIVRRYNTNWLRKRGRSSIQNPNPIKVYLDNTGAPFGGVKSLRRIDGTDVRSIERFNPGEAQFHFGAGHTSGAILVRTRNSGE